MASCHRRNGVKAQSHREAPCKWREMRRETHGEERPKPKATIIWASAADLDRSTHHSRLAMLLQQLTASASPWVLSPGHQPSKWNVFRLFWGGQGKQVVQVNPRNTTSRRTRWALRVLRYLANFWST